MRRSNKRPLAVLNIKLLQKINDFIAKMRGISLNMANNLAIFPLPFGFTFKLSFYNIRHDIFSEYGISIILLKLKIF